MLSRVTRVPLRPALADLPPYVPGARVPVGAAAFKLSSNENPYPPLPSVVLAISDAAEDVNRYPDMYATELTAAIASSLGVSAENVVAGCGSVAVLGHVLTAVCRPDDEVVVPWRSFEAYPIAVTLAGAQGVHVPVGDDGRLDLEAMAAAVTPRTRAVLVCTPNNPTGPAVHADELATFLAAVPKDVLVVLDEAYVEFVRDPQAPDGLAVYAEHAERGAAADVLEGVRPGRSAGGLRGRASSPRGGHPGGVHPVRRVPRRAAGGSRVAARDGRADDQGRRDRRRAGTAPGRSARRRAGRSRTARPTSSGSRWATPRRRSRSARDGTVCWSGRSRATVSG